MELDVHFPFAGMKNHTPGRHSGALKVCCFLEHSSLLPIFCLFFFLFFKKILKFFFDLLKGRGKLKLNNPFFTHTRGLRLHKWTETSLGPLQVAVFVVLFLTKKNSTYFYLAFRFLPTGVCVWGGRHDRGQLYTTHTLFLGGLQLSREIIAQKRTERGCLAWWYLASCVFPVTPYVQRPETVAFFFPL